MRVTELLATTCVVPLERAGLSISTRALTERHYTIVRVRTDTGAEGIGFTYCGNLGGRIVTLAVQDLLRNLVIGRDPHETEYIWDSMYRETLLHGRRGAILRAMSAIDIALWDVVSKEAGLPLYKYLGGYKEGAVPAYASGGYYADGKGPEGLAEEMIGYTEMGFNAVKMKLGRLSPKEDNLRVKAAREAIGPDGRLFLDANNVYPDADTAIRAVEMFEDHNPGWIEEPLMPDDIRGHSKIASSVRTPVATGEIHATRWDFQQILEADAASILQPDVGVCGGITEIQRIAAIASAHDKAIAPHWFADLHVHIVASNPNATWVEYFTDTSIINLGKLLTTRLQVKARELVLPQTPGHGMELDDVAAKKISIEDWS